MMNGDSVGRTSRTSLNALFKDVPANQRISTKADQYVSLDRTLRRKVGFCTGDVPSYELPSLQFTN